MPKLHEGFISARIQAFDIAIAALSDELEIPQTSYEMIVEIKFLSKKLKREQERFIEKFVRR